jgi:peptidoglycan pentaglycine glycine transferase (the first glycine)
MALGRVVNPPSNIWNGFVASQPGASIFQSYEWGQIRKSQGWEPHYITITDGNDWVGCALVLVRHLPGGLGALLYSPCGPLVESNRAEILQALIETVRELATKVGGVFWRIDPRIRAEEKAAIHIIESSGFNHISQEWSYWNRPKYDMHLNLTVGEEKLFQALGRKNRWKVRSALKEVEIESGTSSKDVEAFYELLKLTAGKKGILVQGQHYYKKCVEALAPSSMIRVFIAKKDGRPVAAGISTRYGAVTNLLHMSNDYSVPNMGWGIQWEMIRWAIMQGCQIYDFAGTATNFPPSKNDKGYGVYQFKRSFGAEIVAWYGYADQVFRPVPYRLFRTLERSLPYGERLFVDWPKGLLYRLRGHRAALTGDLGEKA